MRMNSFADMRGRTIAAIEQTKDGDGDTIEVRFTFTDGGAAMLYHAQDCCEWVRLEDIAGNLDDLIGEPLVIAEESSNEDNPGNGESSTWTFYLLATVKGFVTLRWVGTSNGYYSESVYFREIAAKGASE